MAAPDAHLKTGGEHKELMGSDAAHAVSAEIVDAWQQMKLRHAHQYLVFRIEDGEVVIDSAGDPNASLADLKGCLPYTDCRFAVFDHQFSTHDGRKTGKVYFISWLPNHATPRSKMAYTHAKGMVRDQLDGVFDCQAADGSDIDRALGLQPAEEEEEELSDIDL